MSSTDKVHMAREARLRDAFFDRLMLATERAGLSKADIARAVWASESTVGAWFRPSMKSLPEGIKMLQLPAVLGVNGHWLLTGEGQMFDKSMEGADATEAIARMQIALGAIRADLSHSRQMQRASDVEARVARKNAEAAGGTPPERRKRRSGERNR